MRGDEITDAEVKTADPEKLIQQYEHWIFRLANRYTPILERSGSVDIDDLIQVGRIAVLQAQQKYDCSAGASFFSYSAYYIKKAMRRILGFNNQTGELPAPMVYLDTPIDEESEDTILDTIADPNILDNDERLEQQEICEAIHTAIDRLKSEKQREIITRSYLNGDPIKAIAADLGMKVPAAHTAKKEGLNKLERDPILKELASWIFPHHVSLSKFRQTWESEQEVSVLRQELIYDEKYGTGAFAEKIRQNQRQRIGEP